MIRAYCVIAEGTALSVELKSGQPVTGRASWVNGHNVGVTFDQPVDVIEILSASADGPRPRMPRIEVDCIATVRDGANVYRLPVCDISQGGLKVKGDPALEHGCDLSVSLPGLEPQPAASTGLSAAQKRKATSTCWSLWKPQHRPVLSKSNQCQKLHGLGQDGQCHPLGFDGVPVHKLRRHFGQVGIRGDDHARVLGELWRHGARRLPPRLFAGTRVHGGRALG